MSFNRNAENDWHEMFNSIAMYSAISVGVTDMNVQSAWHAVFLKSGRMCKVPEFTGWTVANGRCRETFDPPQQRSPV
ncbi:hypothetical protein MAR_019731 [Mya arenaria]|uniref:Uncharacterized protein n=1 Tax=Mya arenaria TaxID=6604 RepID=A0ABY7E6E8_MYAAR|nr:hypothetical protein MAR_019731 [Mya arenaria]